MDTAFFAPPGRAFAAISSLKVVNKKGTEAIAKAYLDYLYSNEGQDIAGRSFYRPRSEAAFSKYAKQFSTVNLFTVNEMFGGWEKAQKTHFNDGGFFLTRSTSRKINEGYFSESQQPMIGST